MGTDKAFVEIDGRPMVLLVADALRAGGCDPVSCQGGEREPLEQLGLVVRADAVVGGPDGPSSRPGPVRAIADALAAASAPTVVIAACDLPGLTGEVVAVLVRTSRSHGAPAVATANGRRHLLAAWPAAAHTAVVDAIARGIRSYGDVLADLGAIEVAVDPQVVRNVNRPEELP